MCAKRSCDGVALAVSVLVGVAFAILSFFDLLITGIAVPVFALAFGAASLLLLALASASLLRQNACYDRCICQLGHRLAIAALLLIAVAAITLLVTPVNAIVTIVLIFLLFTLLALTFFTLYCLLACLIGAGCENSR